MIIHKIKTVDLGYETQRCYQNVKRHCETHGGEIVAGWIYDTNKYFGELIHHYVWRSPYGELLCFTPQRSVYGYDFPPTINFVIDADASVSKDGQYLPNRWVAHDKRFDQFCELVNKASNFESQDEYDKAVYWRIKANKILKRLTGRTTLIGYSRNGDVIEYAMAI